MAYLNDFKLIGNLTRDPEVRYTPKGAAVVEIGVASNRVWFDEAGTKQEEVTFIDVTFWGKQAENIGQYLSKGREILIEARIALDQWEDKETGKKRQKLKVVGLRWQFLGPKPTDRVTPQTADQATARADGWGNRLPDKESAGEKKPVTPPDPIPEDDIPF